MRCHFRSPLQFKFLQFLPARAHSHRAAAATALVALIGLAVPDASGAVSIIVPETGDARVASATAVDAFFSTPPPATAFGSAPTVTIHGEISDPADIDWFSFFGPAGETLLVDTDNQFALINPIDSVLSLFDSAGTLLAFGDDFAGDPGSVSGVDSFIGAYTLPADDTYYLAITAWSNLPTAFTTGTRTAFTRPDGAISGTGDTGAFSLSGATVGDDSFSGGGGSGVYSVHVSVTPEPHAAALFGVSLLLVSGLLRRRRPRCAA